MRTIPRMLPLVLCASWALAAVSWAEDAGDSAESIQVELQNSDAFDAIKKAEEEARERTERWKKQKQSGKKEEIFDEATLEKLYGRIPGGPAHLDDLRAEAIEEQRQLAKQGIEQAVQHQSDSEAIKPLFRNWLIAAFGDMSTVVGRFVTEALTTPKGYRRLARIDYKALPEGIAGLFDGHVWIDPAKGDNITVVSHEYNHQMGRDDNRPPQDMSNSAYYWMGKEFAGGGKSKGNVFNEDSEPESFTAFQCSGL